MLKFSPIFNGTWRVQVRRIYTYIRQHGVKVVNFGHSHNFFRSRCPEILSPLEIFRGSLPRARLGFAAGESTLVHGRHVNWEKHPVDHLPAAPLKFWFSKYVASCKCCFNWLHKSIESRSMQYSSPCTGNFGFLPSSTRARRRLWRPILGLVWHPSNVYKECCRDQADPWIFMKPFDP